MCHCGFHGRYGLDSMVGSRNNAQLHMLAFMPYPPGMTKQTQA